MMKQNRFRIPAAFALFLCLFTGVWAQQDAAVIQSSGSGSEARPSATSELEAKKALYKELGVEWTYDEGASLDVARDVMYQGVVQNPAEPDRKLDRMMAEFQENRAEWMQNNQEKYLQYAKELGIPVQARHLITAEEFQAMDAEKRAYVKANPLLFELPSNVSTK